MEVEILAITVVLIWVPVTAITRGITTPFFYGSQSLVSPDQSLRVTGTISFYICILLSEAETMGLQPAGNCTDLHLFFTGCGGVSVGLLGMQRC